MLDNNQYNKIDRLVIIDAGVRDSEILASGVVKEAAVAILEANKNGIDQINDILALQPHIESLHLISHGNPGCIFLGNTELSLNTLDLYTEQISQWSIPQILLYGCQVAAGDAGAEFIEKLQQLSGAEIAASTSLTGDASQGGNWLLEIATGEATFDLALEPTAMEAYQHTLVTIDGNSPTFDGNIFNTGYNGAGGQQLPSLADAVWEVSNLIDYANLPQPQPLTTSNPFDTTVVTSWSPADVVDVEPRQWVQSPFGASQWISYNPPTGTSETTHAGNKDLYFRYNFDLQNFDPTAFALQLDFYADNDVFEIYVNGVAQSPNVAAIALNNSTDTDTRKSYTAIGYVANAKLSAELKNNWQVGTNEIIVHVKSGATRVGFLADFDVTKTKPIVDLDGDNSSGTVSSNYKNTFTAGGSSINIVDTDIKILDNTQGDTTKKQIQSVTFTLTNPQAGDELLVGTLPNGITPTTVNQGGQIIVTLTTGTGTGSISDYIAALKEIKFNNSIGNDPDNTDRLINVAITDGNGNVSSTATSTIVVLDGVTNQPPAIGSDGGGDTATKDVPENTTTVTTVTSTDPNAGDTLTYSIVGGTDGAKFQIDPTTGALSFITAPNFEAPTDTDGNNSYVVQVQVADGKGGTDTQTLTVNVTNANEPPAITSDGGGDTATKGIPENTTTVTTVTSTDPDNDTPTYSIVGGTDGAKFQIDPTTGALSFITAPDFEAPTDADGNNSYVVQVQVADGKGGTDTQTLTVNVTDVNETVPNQPPLIGSDGGGDTATKGITENTTTVTTVTSTDPNNDTPSYSIVGGTDGAKFQIDPTTGALSFITAPNFEAPTDTDGNNSYVVQVQVADGKGGTDTQTLTVNVTNANEPPVITSDGGGTTATKGIPENTTTVTTVTSTDPDNDTPTYSIVGGTDGAKFQIDPTTGALSFITAPDFEAPTDADGNNSYVVQVQVADGKGGTDTQTLTVNVTDVNETVPNQPPLIGSDGGGDTATKGITENTTTVTTVTSTDPNNDTPSYSIVGGTDGAKFQIDTTTGALSFITAPDFEAPTDADGNNSYVVQVQVADGKGGTDTQTLTVNVTNVDETLPNQAPAITSGNNGQPVVVSTPENTVPVPYQVAATDPNGDPLTYSINPEVGDGNLFTIDPQGNISFKTAPDFELPTDGDQNNSYVIQVAVSDGKGGTDVQDVTINVTDLDENAPTVSIVSPSPTKDTTPPLTGTVDDPEATVTVNIDGKDYPAINNGDGTWTIPDDTIDPLPGDGTYPTKVTAVDKAGNSAVDDGAVIIDTTAPTVTVDRKRTNDGTPELTGTVNDPNAIVKVTVNGVEYTATNNGTTWTIPNDTIAPALVSNTYDVTATATDPAGNAGTDGTTGELVVDSTAIDVTLNTPPNNDTTPTLTGSVSKPNAAVKVKIGDTEYPAINNGDGTWTLPGENIAPALADGRYPVLVTATDDLGNTGSTEGNLTIDNTPPTVTINTLVTNDSTPVLTGTVSEPVSNLEITVNGNTYTATVNGTNWTIPNNTIAPPLPDSVYDVGATATDLSGNVGQDTTTGELTIDTTAPSAPTITSPTRTDDTTPKIEGGATPNTDLLVDIDLNNDGIPDATYSTKSDAQGNWSIDLGTATPISGQKPTLKNGDRFGVSALALDSLGNRSTRANQTVEIIPLATVTDDTVNAALSGSTPIDVLANDSEGLKIVSVTPPTGGGKVTIDDNGTPNDPSDDRLLYTPPASGLALQRSSGQNIFRIVGDGSSPAFTDTFTYTVQDPNGTTRTATVNANVPANASGGTTGLEFAYLNADASCNNEVGFFKVDDDAGTINGVAPSDPNYVQTALSSGRVIFSAINDSAFNDDRTRVLDGFSSEDRINFFLVRGGTVDGVLDDLEAGTNAAPVYFGSPSGNENDYNAATISDAEGGGFTIDWEDSGDGDDDFNDTSIQVKLTNATAPLGSNLQGDRERELLDLSSTTSDTAATFQVGSNASFNNTVGFYRVQNAEGAIVDEVTGATINPGDANYAKVAVRQSINAVNKNSNGASGSFEAGAIYAPVIVSNASLAEFISQNPDNIASDEDINAYFSYMGANPDKTDHVRLLGDNTFGFEDQFQGGDLDFNDFIVKVNFSVDEPLLTIA
jgi:hypothetical protein